MAIVFQDNFDHRNPLGNWQVDTALSATALTVAHHPVASHPNSAHLNNSKNRMYHSWVPTKKPVRGHIKASFAIYVPKNTTQTRFYGDIRGNGSGVPTGPGQAFAAGVYNVGFGAGTGIFRGQAMDPKKFQGRVLTGTNSGWFNLYATRKTGWHTFEIERSTDEKTVQFFVDGVADIKVTGVRPFGIDLVLIGSVGQSVGVVGDAYFDDVSITT